MAVAVAVAVAAAGGRLRRRHRGPHLGGLRGPRLRLRRRPATIQLRDT